jgi:hypothetical protein
MKKKLKHRSLITKDLHSDKYYQRIVQSKKGYDRDGRSRRRHRLRSKVFFQS